MPELSYDEAPYTIHHNHFLSRYPMAKSLHAVIVLCLALLVGCSSDPIQELKSGWRNSLIDQVATLKKITDKESAEKHGADLKASFDELGKFKEQYASLTDEERAVMNANPDEDIVALNAEFRNETIRVMLLDGVEPILRPLMKSK